MEDWAEIGRLRRAEGMSILAIARVMGVSRNTVKRAYVADGPPRYQRPVRGSIVDAVEPQIRELLGGVAVDAGDGGRGVERANGYLETSLLPGRMFSDPADFNTQLGDWLQLANQRHRRALGCAPAERIDADRAAMLELPPVAPATGWRQTLRLPRDHYVRLDANDYPAPPATNAPASSSPATSHSAKRTGSRQRVRGGIEPSQVRVAVRPCQPWRSLAALLAGHDAN